MKVPTRETGTASSGMSVARHPWRKTKTTTMTSARAIHSVTKISWMPSVTARVVSRATA